ncbi:MAG TPA: SDR family NAD(P)-dependent oxidoreductase [Alphaproteobacteria bacterium]|nr:SDR family NAD(P)-dependent oxidoreductase [Alphaproteobacteria bacterium]
MATSESRPLEGKIVLVTGASRGIGRGIAVELAAAGAITYITGRTVVPTPGLFGTLGEAVAEAAELGGTIIPLACDHADDAAVRKVFDRIEAEHGRLDLLVNNATAMEDYHDSIGKPFWQLSPSVWDSTMNVGLRSAFIATQMAAPLMVAQGGGLIVNVSSIGSQEYLLSVPYGACKAALHKLTHDTAIELTPHNVVVTSIWPGLVKSEPMLAVSETMPDGRLELMGVDLCVAETPRFSGRAVLAIATDPDQMRFAGQYLICADLAHRYGFTDLDGNMPPVVRTNADVFAGLDDIPPLYAGLYMATLAAGQVPGSKLGIRLERDAAGKLHTAALG